MSALFPALTENQAHEKTHEKIRSVDATSATNDAVYIPALSISPRLSASIASRASRYSARSGTIPPAIRPPVARALSIPSPSALFANAQPAPSQVITSHHFTLPIRNHRLPFPLFSSSSTGVVVFPRICALFEAPGIYGSN